jgi:hypothetical protein
MRAKIYWFCTTCERLPAGGECDQPICHGPIAGGWFPAYRGPLRKAGDYAHQWCFMCGQPATAAVRVADHYMGVCATHINHLRTRVRREGGQVRDVFMREQNGVWGCLDDELRPR